MASSAGPFYFNSMTSPIRDFFQCCGSRPIMFLQFTCALRRESLDVSYLLGKFGKCLLQHETQHPLTPHLMTVSVLSRARDFCRRAVTRPRVRALAVQLFSNPNLFFFKPLRAFVASIMWYCSAPLRQALRFPPFLRLFRTQNVQADRFSSCFRGRLETPLFFLFFSFREALPQFGFENPIDFEGRSGGRGGGPSEAVM